jgi:hypothetical protein
MLWRIALAVAVGALAFFATAPSPPRLMRRRRTTMDPITYGNEHREDSEMGEPVEYEVLRDHGAKAGGEMGPAFRKGDTRELRPEDAKPLVRAGVLKAVGGNDEKMEGRPLNKMEEPAPEAKRGPGRPRKVPNDDDEDEA